VLQARVSAAKQITAGARQSGLDPQPLDVAACIWCSIDFNQAQAKRALALKIAYWGWSFSSRLLEGNL
jgi:5,10-methylenetetrahydromethanopterin reductase